MEDIESLADTFVEALLTRLVSDSDEESWERLSDFESESISSNDSAAEIIERSLNEPIKKNPVSDDIFNTLSIIKMDENLLKKNETCVICAELFFLNEDILILPCDHVYHKICIKSWFEEQNMCPICRFKLSEDSAHSISPEERSNIESQSLPHLNDSNEAISNNLAISNEDSASNYSNQFLISFLKCHLKNKRCIICRDNFSINNNYSILPCYHIYHENCEKRLFGEQCPICKQDISEVTSLPDLDDLDERILQIGLESESSEDDSDECRPVSYSLLIVLLLKILKDKTCVFCNEKILHTDFEILPCNHIFHKSCMKESSEETCSICKCKISEDIEQLYSPFNRLCNLSH